MFQLLFSYIIPGILAFILSQALIASFDINYLISFILSVITVVIGMLCPPILVIAFVWITYIAWEWNIFITFICISLFPAISFLFAEKIEKLR